MRRLTPILRPDAPQDFASARTASPERVGDAGTTAFPPPTAPVAATRSWLDWRDDLLASPRFQRWAVRFPLTRWIARRRARALFDLCAGFVYSQVLYACVTLRLFDVLAEKPHTIADLARRLALSDDAALRLLEAARSLELVGLRGGGAYGLGALGAALRGNPGVAAMIDHHALLYADLADPAALLRGDAPRTQLAGYWPYAGGANPAALTASETTRYTTLMAQSQAMVAAEILDRYPMGQHACLLDVGGGDGSFVSFVAERAPRLQLMLFDLPSVAARATARFAAAGFGDRANAFGGDIHVDSLPHGADIVTLVRVIHDHDDAGALAILRAIRRALPVGGTVLIAEPMADTRGAEPVGAAYFGFYLLAMGRGRPRTPELLTALLEAAGFIAVRRISTYTPMITSLLAATAA